MYSNILLCKPRIFKENNNKSGILRWVNTVTGESYTDSSINLTKRLRRYYSTNHIKNRILIYNSSIYRAILAYGYSNFNLEIEYCNKWFRINREQCYFDLLKP